MTGLVQTVFKCKSHMLIFFVRLFLLVFLWWNVIFRFLLLDSRSVIYHKSMWFPDMLFLSLCVFSGPG